MLEDVYAKVVDYLHCDSLQLRSNGLPCQTENFVPVQILECPTNNLHGPRTTKLTFDVQGRRYADGSGIPVD